MSIPVSMDELARTLEGRGSVANVRVTPATAVLHRPAAHADGPPPPDGCGHDCQPVG